MVYAENVHLLCRVSITVQLISSFICLYSAALRMLYEQWIYCIGQIQTSQTGVQALYRDDTSPYEIVEFSLWCST